MCAAAVCLLLQGCALSSNVVFLQLDPASGVLSPKVVVKQPWLDVTGWALPQLPALITDILISLDDKWLFFSNWLRGKNGSGCLTQRGGDTMPEVRLSMFS